MNLCWGWKENQHNIGFKMFKLLASTNQILWLTHYIYDCICFAVYDY